jgi:hypothetical protein
VPVATSPVPGPGRAPRALPAGLALLTAVAGLLAGGLVLAGPAAAADDPARPDARVTHGPSCRPGGVAVEVTAGTVAYAVTLATTRTPAGEDSAELQPGEVAVLRTGDVAWGERIDSRLEYAALDGSGDTHVDELDGFEFTRPAEEDCAAIASPSGPGDAPPGGQPEAPSSVAPAAPPSAPPSVSPERPPGAEATPGPDLPSGVVPAPEGRSGAGVPLPVPRPPAPRTVPDAGSGTGSGTGSGSAAGEGAGAPEGDVVASAGTVAAGDAVTLSGDGFEPGEVVTVRVAGGRVLASVPAGADGAVEATVRVPGADGSTTLELVGADSEVTAEVRLRVAAAARPVDPAPAPVPLVVAGVALVLSATGLVLTAARRRPDPAAPAGPTRSA